ncbi:MAG: hypothetical protein IT159_04220 [Bryobacterales bacterium]|nr:hypothetical protein [Bryobacterales bacterium]
MNLDALKEEVVRQLTSAGLTVFEGFGRHAESRPVAFWDTRTRPDFSHFLATARQAGVKMVVFHHLEFVDGMAEDALDRLEECDMPAEERRAYERKLRQALSYHGFTCSLEVSYDLDGRTYIYEVQADWYGDFLHILDEIEDYSSEAEDDEDDESMGGYFSRN